MTKLVMKDDDEFFGFELKLGEATVLVEYVIFCGSVFVQGAVIRDAWVDIDNFSQSVRKSWTEQIETELGI